MMSEHGPDYTVIDCQGSAGTPRRAFTFDQERDSSVVIRGLTIKGGYGPSYNGRSCGGAVLCDGVSPALYNCIFTGNHAKVGGALYATDASPTIVNCDFVHNDADTGAAISVANFAYVDPEHCIIAYNTVGLGVVCGSASDVTLYCCDVYGNQKGNWVGCLIGQQYSNDNFSADPLFCSVTQFRYGIGDENSPCLPENNACGVVVGALGLGCSCDCGMVFGDVNSDEALNPVDVVYMVNYVYKQQDARVAPSNCPFPTGDVDCNNQVNPVDIVYYVNKVYKSQDAFCDPCG
jgi:hypothetical protein